MSQKLLFFGTFSWYAFPTETGDTITCHQIDGSFDGIGEGGRVTTIMALSAVAIKAAKNREKSCKLTDRVEHNAVYSRYLFPSPPSVQRPMSESNVNASNPLRSTSGYSRRAATSVARRLPAEIELLKPTVKLPARSLSRQCG